MQPVSAAKARIAAGLVVAGAAAGAVGAALGAGGDCGAAGRVSG